MKKQGNMVPSKAQNPSITELKYTKMADMPNKEFKSLLIKMISDFKQYLSKQLNEVKKSFQDLDKKVINTDEKFSKDIEIP